MKSRKKDRRSNARSKRPRPMSVRTARRSNRRRKAGKRGFFNFSAPVAKSKLHTMRIADFYRPLKKPVTLRLDADVIAWFKKDGRRYQTRINAALRKVMEREMRVAGG
jgi:uncharacterized protein (DUF4415 family)